LKKQTAKRSSKRSVYREISKGSLKRDSPFSQWQINLYGFTFFLIPYPRPLKKHIFVTLLLKMIQHTLLQGYLMDNNQLIDTLREENNLLKQQLSKITQENQFNHKYRDLVNSLGEIVVVAQDNRIVYGNRKLEESFGLPLEEISSVPFTEFIHPDDRDLVMKHHKQRIEDKEYDTTYSFRIVNITDQHRWIKVSAVHIEWQGRVATLNILADIHERVIAEQGLIEAKKHAEDAAKMEARFLANMSHEIRTPMNGVLGMTRLLLDTELDETQKHYLTTVEYSSQYLLCVINDILDYSSIEAGKMSIFSDSFDILHSLEQLKNTFSYLANDKNILFEHDIASNIPRNMFGDQTRITQILTNLLSNAVKFTKKGSVTLSVSRSKNDETIIFTVTDTGIGIPQDMVKKIFSSFMQVENHETRNYEGTGLGLAISKQLANLMNGTLICDSAASRGTTFTLTLPLKEDTSEHSIHFPRLSKKEYDFLILVVEDNDINYLVIQKFLEKLGCKATRSTDGYSAIDEIEKNRYDMIFIDVQMPGINGYETTKRIRELSSCKQIPIIAMTANAMKQDEKRCYDAGMNFFLSKPIEFKKIPSILDQIGTVAF